MKKRMFCAILALSLVMACTLAACGGGAAAMHLRRTEGSVSVSDSGGKDVPVLDNLGLYSGYGVGTRSASYAWIDLDDVKLTKLDQNSEIAIQKEGRALGIELKSGSLFFNVTQPLEDDETMNISTSTMLIGIRGTCGWVEANNGLSRVYLLEGKVECSAGEQTVQVNAGEFVWLTADGELVVKPFTDEDIPAFVQDEVDPDLPGGADETPGVLGSDAPEITETPETAAPEEEQHIGAYTPKNITGNLSLSDFTYDYVDEENAVGRINLYFTVNGPAEVRDVLIMSIGPQNFTQEEIDQGISQILPIWEEEGISVSDRMPPYKCLCSFLVLLQEERGTTENVVLFGVGEGMTAVGYAVVTLDIP